MPNSNIIPPGFVRVGDAPPVIPKGFVRVGDVPDSINAAPQSAVIPPGLVRVGDAPTDTPKPKKAPKPPPERMAGLTREQWAGVGGMAGGMAVGIPSGPLAPLSVAAGAGLGAGIGSVGFDSAKALKAYFSGKPEEMPGVMDIAKPMVKEGLIEGAFTMGAGVVRPVLWSRAALAKASGLTDATAKELMEKAKRLGIGVGAVDVGTMLPKAYAKTIGVFPWSGTPFRKGEIAKHSESLRVANDILDTFGPNKSLTDTGIDMVEAARGTYKGFRGVAARLYGDVNDAIRAADRIDIIPTNTTKKLASELKRVEAQGAIRLTGKEGKTLPRVESEDTIKYIEGLADLPELITPQQYKRLKNDIAALVKKNINDGWDVKRLVEIKGAVEADLRNIRVDLLPEQQGTAILDALKTADTFYAKGIVQFQTRSAKRFMRVDKNIFKAGAEEAGSLNADEIYNVAVNLKSPMEIRDLSRLIGQPAMKRAASLHFQTAVDAAIKDKTVMGQVIKSIDPVELEKGLGITKKTAQGVKEFYRVGGVDFKDVQDFIEVMKRVEGIGNPAEFMRRRIILGSIGAVTAAGGVGFAGATASAPVMLATTILSRHGSKIFADPVKLKLMTTAFDEAANTYAARAAYVRLAKMLTAIEKREEKEQTPE